MSLKNTFFNSSPLSQFDIIYHLDFDFNILNHIKLSLTNLGLYLVIGTLFVLIVSIMSNNNKIISNKWSLGKEALFTSINNIVINQIDSKKGQLFLPFIYTLFIFILVNNLIGMIPYSFASTSHFVLTFSLSFTIVLGATIIGFIKHSLGYFGLLVPTNTPLPIVPLLVLIEFISYLARNISLGLRLGANIFSGHMLLNILCGFTYKILNGAVFPLGFFLTILPLSFIILFSGLELAIAFIQAQVFIILTCSYIKDAIKLH
jgi:F-type H+-transporting ATPase subunit a